MDYLEAELQRTWVQLLLENNYNEIAAMALDTDIERLYKTYEDEARGWMQYYYGIAFIIPASSYALVNNDDLIKNLMERAIRAVSVGHINAAPEELEFEYRVKLIEPEEDWREVVRELITHKTHPNQGIVTEKVFLRKGKAPIVYNEMNFASKTEVRIAQELEEHSILFFPLALAVRAETSILWKDHREVDFLICDEGVWGILEIAHHPDRYEVDKEKDFWFKKSGILCVEHYTAKKAYKSPAMVVDEFLETLAKFKR